jgi:Sorting nexin 8/Mvp1 BAR domain
MNGENTPRYQQTKNLCRSDSNALRRWQSPAISKISSRAPLPLPYQNPVLTLIRPNVCIHTQSLVRNKLNLLIEHWQRICLITERLVKRRESAAADLSRMTMTLNALVEGNGECWRGEECELCGGVRTGLGAVARHASVAADSEEQRVRGTVFVLLFFVRD